MVLLYGHDKEVADWVSKRQGYALKNWFHAVGILDKTGILIGCASLHDMNGSNAELSFWGPRAITCSVIRDFSRFTFEQLDVHRLSARIPRQNKMLISHMQRYGFKFEGVLRHYYGPVKRLDAIMFGLLAKDAKRLMGRAQ